MHNPVVKVPEVKTKLTASQTVQYCVRSGSVGRVSVTVEVRLVSKKDVTETAPVIWLVNVIKVVAGVVDTSSTDSVSVSITKELTDESEDEEYMISTSSDTVTVVRAKLEYVLVPTSIVSYRIDMRFW